MQDIHSILAALHRPRLLMRAARIGADSYHRASHLPRLLGYGNLPRHTQALVRLIDIEAEHERLRTARQGSYIALAHVDVLIAILGESRLLHAARDAQQAL